MEQNQAEFVKRGCAAFKPMPTNKDVCAYWMVYGGDEFCRKDLWCSTRGMRPEREDQESDSEE